MYLDERLQRLGLCSELRHQIKEIFKDILNQELDENIEDWSPSNLTRIGRKRFLREFIKKLESGQL